MKIRLGIPKGSLQDSTIKLFKKAGFNIIVSDRSYKPSVDDEEIECLLIRAQEIPKYVEKGVLDLGLSGKDWIAETNADVKEIAELIYSKQGYQKVKIVLAVPEKSDIKKVEDLKGKRIASELVNVTEKYLKEKKIKAAVEFSWGATEIKAPDLVDAIVDLTETGNSLRANKLKVLDIIMESTTRLIANKNSLKNSWKNNKINEISLLLSSALVSENMVGLKMNVSTDKVKNIIKILPALRKPTVSKLADDEWIALDTIIEEKKAREMIPKLKKLGAEGIVEYPLNKVVL